MKRLFLVAMMAMVAACSSTSPVATGVPDAASTADTGKASDSSATADTGSAADTGAADAGPTDAGSKDTKDVKAEADVPPVSDKCDPTDGTCLNTCANDSCSAELGGCLNNASCKGLYMCFYDCQKGTSLPDDVTGATCQEKCMTKFDKQGASLHKLLTMNVCIEDQCVQCTVKKPQACMQACAQNLCSAENAACGKTTDCTGIEACTLTCADQACVDGCIAKANDNGKKLYNAAIDCAQGHLADCQ